MVFGEGRPAAIRVLGPKQETNRAIAFPVQIGRQRENRQCCRLDPSLSGTGMERPTTIWQLPSDELFHAPQLGPLGVFHASRF